MSAASDAFPTFTSLAKLLEPEPNRFAHALRLAIVCTLTLLVVEVYQTPSLALTTYVAFFLVKPDRAESVVLSIAIMVLFVVIVGSLLLIANAVMDTPSYRVASMVAISLALMFAASWRLSRAAPIVALVCAYALDLLAQAHTGELATRLLLYAWLFVGIPAGVTIAVSLIGAPSPARLVARAVALRLAVAARVMREADDDARRALARALEAGTAEIRTWLNFAGIERATAAEDLNALRRAGDSITPVLLLVDWLDRHRETRLSAALAGTIAGVLQRIASEFDAGRVPHAALADPIEEAHWSSLEGRRVGEELAALLAHMGDRGAPSRRGGAERAAEPSALADPNHARFALKATFAAMFCYVTYTILDWPGIHTALISCYIVSLPTAAETIEKLTLRVVGCLIGAAAGTLAIVFVMPSVMSIGGLMAVVFFAALAAGWVAAGSPRVSYAGFQIAFAFFLCVIQGPSPEFDLSIARDRVVGILLGNFVAYVVFTHVWPVSIHPRIDRAIATVLERLHVGLSIDRPRARAALVSDAHDALCRAADDLEIGRYEPRSIRQSPAWIDARRDAVREIRALEPIVLLSEPRTPPSAALIEARIARVERMLATPMSEEPRHAPT